MPSNKVHGGRQGRGQLKFGGNPEHRFRNTVPKVFPDEAAKNTFTDLQLQQQQIQQQLQRQALQAQSAFGAGAAGTGVGAGVGGGVFNMPSYADQMHAAFVDYQRQRQDFEQQQQQLLQNLYHYYPDVSGVQQPVQAQGQAQGQAQYQPQVQQQQPQQQRFQGGANTFGSSRQQFGSNGLQAATNNQPSRGSGAGFGSVPLRTAGAGDFYSTQHHLGFMQQQHQDVLRDQQQSVAQQFATSQLAPTTRQTFGMAVPMSSVLSAPSYQASPDASHVSFSSGNLKYNF